MAPIKIALIGSAPSSVALAPYNDPSWQVWACSPGARPHVVRSNIWFEIHKWEPDKPWFSEDYRKFLAEHAGPVMVFDPAMMAVIPSAQLYPKERMLEKWGPYVFTSTVAWMMALAIEAGAEEIGLWGIDMAAQEEWQWQRQGCQHFIWEAKKLGIKVTIPDQSDLLRPPPLYGFCELDPMHGKMLARAAELDFRIAQTTQMFTAKQAEAQQMLNEIQYLRGAREDIEYVIKTWVSDRQAMDMVNWTGAVAGDVPWVEPAISNGAATNIPPVEFSISKEAEAPKLSASERMNSFIAGKGVQLGAMPETVTWGSTPAIELSNGLGG